MTKQGGLGTWVVVYMASMNHVHMRHCLMCTWVRLNIRRMRTKGEWKKNGHIWPFLLPPFFECFYMSNYNDVNMTQRWYMPGGVCLGGVMGRAISPWGTLSLSLCLPSHSHLIDSNANSLPSHSHFHCQHWCHFTLSVIYSFINFFWPSSNTGGLRTMSNETTTSFQFHDILIFYI